MNELKSAMAAVEDIEAEDKRQEQAISENLPSQHRKPQQQHAHIVDLQAKQIATYAGTLERMASDAAGKIAEIDAREAEAWEKINITIAEMVSVFDSERETVTDEYFENARGIRAMRTSLRAYNAAATANITE